MQAETEFIVDTECGRHFCWSAPDYEFLVRRIHERGYKATFIMPLTEYEAEILAKESQEDLMHEFRTELERELKESA
jgi:hypothetical protein